MTSGSRLVSGWPERAYWSAFALWQARGERKLPFRDLEQILEIQNRRVRRIVRHAYETVPHYREAMDDAGLRPGDFQTGADLARLPLVTARDLVRDPKGFRSTRFERDAVELHSSGTSGRAKPLPYDPAALFIFLGVGRRQREVLRHFIGRTLGYRELSVFRTGGVPAQMERFFQARSFVAASLGITPSEASVAEPFERLAATINDFRPDVIKGYGSHLGAFFRWAHRRAVSLFRPRVVTYGADLMPDADRRLIEQEYGIPVLAYYQTAEILRLAFQCERRAGFHIDVDLAAVRVIDSAGRTLGPGGRGEIVVSNLINRATVLLNYKVGDVVTLGTATCPCGRTLPTLERIEGRADDLILAPGGYSIHPLAVLGVIYDRFPELIQVQVVQEAIDLVRMRVVYGAATDWERVAAELGSLLRETLPGIAVEVLRADSIEPGPSGKVRTVIRRF